MRSVQNSEPVCTLNGELAKQNLKLVLFFAFYVCGMVQGGTVSSITFFLPDQQCYVGNTDGRAVISFTPAALLPSAGVITIGYPAGFFAPVAPVVINGGAVVVSAAAPDSSLNVLLLTVISGSLAASTPFTMTLSGLHITKIPSGSVESIKVTTTTDTGLSQGASTGNCFEGSWSGVCEQVAGFRSSDKSARCSRSACSQKFTFEFYVGNIRRRFSSVPDNSCYAAASSDVLSPFAFLSGSTSCQVQDTIITPISSGFLPGQRILTVTTAPDGIGCYEIWTNTTHFLEQGNQRSESANFQAAASCPLCRNCATGSTCEGRCNVQGTLTCSDPLPIGIGPIEWNYRCSGRRDNLNNLQRFLTNEYQVGLKSWRKNTTDGTLNQEWFVSQASKALLVPNDAVVVLSAREDFFNDDLEGFKVPTSDQGASDRGLIVAFMVAREHREQIEINLRLQGHRLVLRRFLNAVSIRLRVANSSEFQAWARLEPITIVDPEAEIDPTVPMVLFVSCAAIGMIPRSFWRAFPALIRGYQQRATKAAGAITTVGDEEEEESDEDENKD